MVSLSSGHDKQSRDNTFSPASVNLPESSVEMDNKIPNNESSTDRISTPPPLCNLDMEVIRNLPSDVFSELNEIYRGKLIDYIANWKNTSESSSPSGNSFLEQKGKLFRFISVSITLLKLVTHAFNLFLLAATNNEEELSYSEPIPQINLFSKNKVSIFPYFIISYLILDDLLELAFIFLRFFPYLILIKILN